MAITAPRSFSVQTVLGLLWQSLPITAEKVTFTATKLSLSVPVANKLFATVLTSQAIWLFASGIIPPSITALITTKTLLPSVTASTQW